MVATHADQWKTVRRTPAYSGDSAVFNHPGSSIEGDLPGSCLSSPWRGLARGTTGILGDQLGARALATARACLGFAFDSMSSMDFLRFFTSESIPTSRASSSSRRPLISAFH